MDFSSSRSFLGVTAREEVIERVHVSPLGEQPHVYGVLDIVPGHSRKVPNLAALFGLLSKTAGKVDERLTAFQGSGVSSELVSGHQFFFLFE
jgi:hypothetical protein